MAKSLFASRTFWFNVAAAAVEVSGAVPLAPGTAATIMAVGNIALRLLTNQPIAFR